MPGTNFLSIFRPKQTKIDIANPESSDSSRQDKFNVSQDDSSPCDEFTVLPGHFLSTEWVYRLRRTCPHNGWVYRLPRKPWILLIRMGLMSSKDDFSHGMSTLSYQDTLSTEWVYRLPRSTQRDEFIVFTGRLHIINPESSDSSR